MTNKELKRMGRSELLELLITQMEENESLRSRLEEAEAELQNRRINLDKAGTMAEASVLLNGVLEAADKAAEQYLENIRVMSESQEEISKRIEEEAREKAATIVEEAEEYSRNLRIETKKYFNQLIAKAQDIYTKKTGMEAPDMPDERDETT